ncbi:DUF4494 family protein [Spirosoma foliorum]|uniref:DUF4494 family protein n=1 Tax=Spirosoma foliorum TaxID=2710596 RepID=A0A7G5H5E1_9BACT|nr:DUF4494 family protein [Spirosoma foliorum]QMW06333.1 DUF4494 family protein [Spirosoma foliorum]
MWRKSKVIYEGMVNRERKTFTEHYLHESISLGDVEEQCAKNLSKRITTGIEMVDSAAKVRFTKVIFFGMQEDDFFFELKIGEWEDNKKTTYTYLLPAVGPEQAIERIKAYMGTTSADWRLLDIKESDILAVWSSASDLWMGDWWNRMDRYYAEGKRMPDANDVTDQEGESGEGEENDDDAPRDMFGNKLSKSGKKRTGKGNRSYRNKGKNRGSNVSYSRLN